MLPLDAAIGIDRLGNWGRSEAFGTRGRYEQADAMTAAARLADWIEISTLFGAKGAFAKTHVLDHFIDSGLSTEDDSEVDSDRVDWTEIAVDELFAELRVRYRLMGDAYPLSVDGDVARRRTEWQDSAYYAFLLLVSSGHLLPWMRTEGTSYHEVGHLFEDVVCAAAEGLFGRPSRTVPVYGSGEDVTLAARMRSLLVDFGRSARAEIDSEPRKTKDGGLDIVARAILAESDQRGASPHVLVQCASGSDWFSKINGPSAVLWHNWVHWRGPIWRAFAIPTLLDDAQLGRASMHGDATFVIDRARIIDGLRRSPARPDIGTRVKEWVASRVLILGERGLALASGAERL